MEKLSLKFKISILSVACILYFSALRYMIYTNLNRIIFAILTLIICGGGYLLNIKNNIRCFLRLELFMIGIYGLIFNIVYVMLNARIEDVVFDVISIAMATNIEEIRSFFVNLVSYKFVIVLAVFCSLLMFYFVGHIEENIKCTFSVNDSVFMSVVVVLTVTFLVLPCSLRNIVKKFPQGIEQIQQTSNYANQKKSFKWNSKSIYNGKSTVVIILGESTRGDRMSINGYYRDTNPNLSKYEIVSFKDAISVGSHTLLATPYILTLKPLRDDNIYLLHPETSILSAYKEAGYKTFYISYLSNMHTGDNAINQIVNEADKYIKRPWGEGYDETALPIINQILDEDVSKKLIVFKLIGSHWNFQDRYPNRFDRFKPSFKTVSYNGDNIKQKAIFDNTYDNTILYTDYIVSEILKKLQSVEGESMMGFISDHGMNIYDDGKGLYHGFARANYNIPLFFWANEKVKIRLSQNKWNSLISNTNKPVSSLYFIDTIFELSGVKTEHIRGKNLFTEITEDDERQVVQGDKLVFYREL